MWPVKFNVHCSLVNCNLLTITKEVMWHVPSCPLTSASWVRWVRCHGARPLCLHRPVWCPQRRCSSWRSYDSPVVFPHDWSAAPCLPRMLVRCRKGLSQLKALRHSRMTTITWQWHERMSEWKSVWIKFNSRHTIGWWGICMGEVCNHINHQN